MIHFVYWACFLCDAAFSFLYLNTAEHKPGIPAPRRYAPVLFLLATFILYPLANVTVSLPSFLLRYLFRLAVYLCYLLPARGTSPAVALYCAAFTSGICTVIQNMFLTPLTFPLLQGEIAAFPSRPANILLCILIVCGVRALCYAYVYLTIPLTAVQTITTPRIAVLTCVVAVSLYIRSIQVPITNTGEETVFAYSVFFILLQAALLLCLAFFEQYQRKLRENTAFQLQQVTTEALLKNLQMRQEKDEEVRALRHDLKNHMLTLRHLVEADRKAEAEKYIDGFLDQAGQSEVRFETGSALLDALMGKSSVRRSGRGSRTMW